MHGRFELQGRDCFGSTNDIMLLLIMLIGLPLGWFLVMRNARDYWMKASRCRGINDPYDMSFVYKDFQARAKVGARLTARGDNGDGFIDAATELSDDSDDERRRTRRHTPVANGQGQLNDNAQAGIFITDSVEAGHTPLFQARCVT